MKILCSKSSVEFDVSHFPGTFYARELCHPIFYLEQRKLLSYARKWGAGELTPTDSYLLFLAILNSSEQVEFRTPAHRGPLTDSIVAAHMESLLRTVIKLNAVSNPHVVFPRFAISNETRTLSNVRYWIEAWQESWQDFQDGNPTAGESRALINREAALQRMIKSPHKTAADYASSLADWAALAGNFPLGKTPHPFKSGESISIADYWRIIIIRCAKQEAMYTIPTKDIKELQEHVQENIPVGSIYSHALNEVLRNAIRKHANYLGFGDPDLDTDFQLLDPLNPSVEQANLQVQINAAPEKEPKPEDYPKKWDYMVAKARWDTARQAKKLGGTK